MLPKTMNSKRIDWLIRHGRVIDPTNRIDGVFDVAITNGTIMEVGANLDTGEADNLYDARGMIVTPGLIDLHTHIYHKVTPLGIDADHYCLGRGVTTAVDAGSAGCDTIPGLRAFSAERFQTRILAYLNISRMGIAVGGVTGGEEPGELESPKFIHAHDCVACIESNRDLLVGVKVRLSASIADGGKNEVLAYLQAREAALATNLPLMVHHSFSTVMLEESPGQMRAGDVYTHCYHGFDSTIVDPESKVIDPTVTAARKRGVLFDIGHGMGAFNWTVAEICSAKDFWPDTISTDLHSFTCEGPGYDQPTVMSKLLHLGMPLVEVVRASTETPAAAIGWQDRIGSLGVGREADVAVFSLEDVDVLLEDCQGQKRPVAQRLKTEAVWKAGEPRRVTEPEQWPNTKNAEKAKAGWQQLVIRDDSPP